MNQKFFKFASLSFAGLASSLCLLAFALYFFCGRDLTQRNVSSIRRSLPQNAFAQSKEAYTAINEPLLSLQFALPKVRLPDLRPLLVYYGKNGRPDVSEDSLKLHFTFNGLRATHSFAAGEKVYLSYDKKTSPCKYYFSANNVETNLWFEAFPEGKGANLCLFMKDENDKIITEPSNCAHFFLPEKEFNRLSMGQTWEIGKWRVDGTLLARQKAKWVGPDRFLEKHGGEEYSELVGKQRINFDDGEEGYSIFVKLGDCLVWDNHRWSVCEPGPLSVGRPLMTVKKVDERLMNLELWDIEGKARVALNLLRSQDHSPTQHLVQEFKFVGARTRTQCVFQVNQTRMIVKPNDWLLLTEGGWKKLTTVEEVDDYVNGQLTGTLFVLDDIVRKDEKSHLVGTMFNPARTDMQTVEIAMQHNHPGVKDTLMQPNNEQKMHAHRVNPRFKQMNASNFSSFPKEKSSASLNPTNINPLANH